MKKINILTICGFALVAASASIILKKSMPSYSLAINIISCTLILALILLSISPVFNQIKNLLENAKIPAEYGTILFKSLGICLLVQFCSDTCEDAKEKALASKVEFAGKAAVLLTALPLFEKIIKTALILASK